MRARSSFRPSLLLLLLAASGRPSLADEFPRGLVAWRPSPANPVFQGAGGAAWDRKIRERGWIDVENGTYRLWYTGYNDDRSPAKYLGHATSPDGIHWTRNPTDPIYTQSWVEDVNVLRRDGVYHMFAEGKDDIAHQLSSRDGLHWGEDARLDIRLVNGKPLGPGSYGTPTVWYEDGTWYLFYERGDQGVWLATSRDRSVWTNVQDTPVLARGPEPYDLYAVALNQIIKREGVYYAFYHANAHRPWKDWTTNIARSRDLVHWEKYPGNPILRDNCSSAVLVRGPKGDRLYTMHPMVRLFEPDVKPAGAE